MPLRKKTDVAKNEDHEFPRLDEKTTAPTVESVKDEATGESRAPNSRGYEEVGGGYGSYRPNRGAPDFSRWPSKERPSPER